MPRRGTTLLDRVWRALTTFEVPGYQVNESVQPVTEVWSHTPDIQAFQQSFVMIVGLNSIVLPGFNRPAVLNPAAFPSFQSKGARRWLALAIASSAALAAGDELQLTYAKPGSAPTGSHALWNVRGATAWAANWPIPVIGGINAPSNGNPFNFMTGRRGSVYVPDPDFLFFSLQSMVVATVVTVTGLFVETDNQAEPLPSMFA